MRAVIQRVKSASVTVDNELTGAIAKGLLVYVGVEKGDGEADIDYILSKITGARIFEDAGGKMNLDIKEVNGAVLLISQFTLHADIRKGRRPSFDAAEEPGRAKELYIRLIERLKAEGLVVEKGEFQAHMEVESVNDGPVTILIDSRRLF